MNEINFSLAQPKKREKQWQKNVERLLHCCACVYEMFISTLFLGILSLTLHCLCILLLIFVYSLYHTVMFVWEKHTLWMRGDYSKCNRCWQICSSKINVIQILCFLIFIIFPLFLSLFLFFFLNKCPLIHAHQRHCV